MKSSKDQLNKLWQKFYKKDLNENYSWCKKGESYYIKYSDNEVYQEPIQHVEAVCKLMRISINLWLILAISVLEASPKKNPMSLSLTERLKLFKHAHKNTIAKYFPKPNKFIIKTNNCPNCTNNSFKNLEFKFTPIRTIALIICDKCGLGIRFPKDTKEDLSKIYKEDYFSGQSTEVGYFDYLAEEKWRIKKAENYLENLEKLLSLSPQNTSVLDVGSGFGYFLIPLKQRKYNYLGIELARDAVDIANNKFKTKTIEGDLLSLYKDNKLKDKSFDLITLWDVIEHFYDFRPELEIISKVLRPGGFVAVRTNNINSIEYDVFGKDFHSIKNEHTYYYSAKTLIEIFQKVKIKPYKIWSHTHLFLSFMSQKEINTTNTENRGGDIFYIGQKYE